MKIPYEDWIVYIFDDLNPEPWTSPQASVGRKGGKFKVQMHSEEQMKNYKDALREAVKQDGAINFGDIDLELRFTFWRQVAAYETPSGNTGHAHVADATNLQKATEDALQGLLFANDRTIRRITSYIASQSESSDARLAIQIRPYSPDTGDGNSSFEAWVGLQLDSDGGGSDPSSNILSADRSSVF